MFCFDGILIMAEFRSRLLRGPVLAICLIAGTTEVHAAPAQSAYVIGAEIRYSGPPPVPRLTYQYKAQRSFSIDLEQSNAGWIFNAADETGNQQVLDVTLPAAFSDEYAFNLRLRVSFFVGKHDFDFDGIPELLIGARSLGPNSNPADNSLSVNVFALAGNDWVRVGDMNGDIIASGDPKAFIVGNRIRIPRRWRGIVLEWAYESGRFLKVP